MKSTLKNNFQHMHPQTVSYKISIIQDTCNICLPNYSYKYFTRSIKIHYGIKFDDTLLLKI